MRLKNIVRSAVAGGASLTLALGLLSCSRDYTVAYVYSVAGGTTGGSVSAYGIDFETGILNQISGSPFAIPFTNPTTVVAAPNNKFIYVIGGSQNAQVEEMAVGTDGKLYGENTYNLTGTIGQSTTTQPTTLTAAIDSTGTYLYVPYTYQSGYGPSSPGPGGVTIFPINSDNSLGTPINLNVGNNPVAVAIAAPVCVPTGSAIIASNAACSNVTGGGSGIYNVYAYVVDQELTSAKPTVLGFAQNTSTGALTPLSGTNLSTFQGAAAGVVPSDVVVDGTSRWVYVTDQEENEVIGYQIASNTGNLTALTGSPFGTGLFPVSLIVDPRSKYVYTANYNSGTVSSFVINQANGNLSTVAGSTFASNAGTSCVTIDPALGQFLYTTNYQAATLSGGEVNANTGAITGVLDSPFPTSTLPSCLISVANGAHSSEQLTP